MVIILTMPTSEKPCETFPALPSMICKELFLTALLSMLQLGNY